MRSNFFLAAAAVLCLIVLQANCKSNGEQVNTNTEPPASPAPTVSAPVVAQQGGDAPLPEGSDARAYFERGMEAYRKDHDAEAVEAFREAVKLEPDFAEAHYRLGLALSAVGERDEAEKSFEAAVKAYEKAAKADAKNPDTHYMLGLAYGRLGKYDDAVKALKESVRNAPDDDDKYYELGLAHSKLAQYKEAIAAFNKALEINPDNFPASDALEKAKPGLARREAFLKQQEKLQKQEGMQKARSRQPANTNTNTNTAPIPAANTAPATQPSKT